MCGAGGVGPPKHSVGEGVRVVQGTVIHLPHLARPHRPTQTKAGVGQSPVNLCVRACVGREGETALFMDE